jgi:hypothetical protein
MNEYAVVVDPAKRRDFTAILTVKKTADLVEGEPLLKTPDRIVNYLDVVHIDKFNGITYPEIVRKVALRVGHADLVNNCDLLIDGTGVGEALTDLLREGGLDPLPIIFTAGTKVQLVYGDFGQIFLGQVGKLATARTIKEMHVPKVDLVDAGRLLAQQGRFWCDPQMRWADDFEAQMQGFRGKVNEKTGRTKFENENDELHDDLIVCYLMAAWWMLQEHENEIPERIVAGERGAGRDWSPLDYL